MISEYSIQEWCVAFTREAMFSLRPISNEELRAQDLVSDVADDAEQLRPRLAMFLSRVKIASPHAFRVSKELVRLGWAHAGGEEQVDGIKGVFEEMMRPGANGAHDEKKKFQAVRKVDWDTLTQGTS